MGLNAPVITVLMPVFNGERYLREAVASILNQSYGDFEFLIIDDGSTDRSAAIIDSYRDPRVRLVRHQANLGLVPTLNRGLELARGKYVARMDCDDISLPDRFAKQVALLEAAPEIGVCGGWIEYFMGRELVLELPAEDQAIKQALLTFNPMAHPTVMIRASVIERHRIRYDPDYPHVEDYELWSRLAALTGFANIPEVLLKYRIHLDQVGARQGKEQVAGIQRIQAKLRQSAASWRAEGETSQNDKSCGKENRGMTTEETQPIPPSPQFKQEIVRKYADQYGIKVLIETGTYLGEMVDAVKDRFAKIITIELAEPLYERAAKLFREFPHIQVCYGDSPKVLPEILAGIAEPCLFWLDAHCSGGITTRSDKVTPIVEELEAILARKQPGDILLIDDARGFDGTNDYPTVEAVAALVNRHDPGYQIENINDIIRIFK
jgi:hypothetical protein